MAFFDSPIFWIVVVWWLLTTFLGAKSRKQRAQRLKEAALQQEPTQAEPSTAEEVEPEPWEPEPPLTTEAEPPARVRAAPPPIFKELWRELGIQVELPKPEVAIPIWQEPEPEELAVEDAVPAAEAAAAEQAPVVSAKERPYKAPLYLTAGMAHLSPWQQAIVYRTVLGRPRALQRDFR